MWSEFKEKELNQCYVFIELKVLTAKNCQSADQKHDTADCRYFGSIAQVPFAAIEITLCDRDRLILSVYLAIVVVAYRFYCTPVLKTPVRYTFPAFLHQFQIFCTKTQAGCNWTGCVVYGNKVFPAFK